MSENKEPRAFRDIDELLSKMELEPTPDLWDAIRPNLQPRPAPSRTSWIARHWIKSTAATAAVAAAIAAWMITAPNTPTFDQQAVLMNHAAMSWSTPFADKAALGLIEVTGAKQ